MKRQRGKPKKKTGTVHSLMEETERIEKVVKQGTKSNKDDNNIRSRQQGEPMKRTNWSKDSRLETAVNDWFNKGLSKFNPNGEEIKSLPEFANKHNIPPFTLSKYCHKDLKKRQQLGSHVGQQMLLSNQDQELIA